MPSPKSKPMADLKSNGEALSKMEGVRRALADLGKDAKPMAIKDYLQSKYKLAMEPSLISNYKGLLLTAKKPQGAKAAAPKASAPAASMPVAAAASVAGSIKLDDLKTIKDITDRLGAERVRELTKLFS